MAGTLVIDAVKSGTSGPPSFQNTSGVEIGQLCRAWVNFNGVTTASIRASFNVSSVTRTATGDYTVNFTTAMPDANFSAQMALSGMTLIPLVRDYLSTSVRVTAAAGNNAQVDQSTVSVAVFR